MLYINNINTDAWFNLAAEEYLLKHFSEDIFMLWQNEPAVVLGKHQDIWSEVDIGFAHDKHIKLSRRFSGGGTVYHDMGNLNLTFIRNSDRIDSTGFTESIIRFLGNYGIPVYADERQGLTVNGLKISGSAQAIHKQRMLHHATLLYSTDLDILNRSLQPATEHTDTGIQSRCYFVKSVKSPVTNISENLSAPISLREFKNSLADYYLENNKCNTIYEFTDQDLAEIRSLRNKKYADENWIFNSYAL